MKFLRFNLFQIGCFIAICNLMFSCSSLAADKPKKTYQLEPVVVYASVIDRYYNESLRQVEIISDSTDTPRDFLVDQWREVAFLDISRRGVFDIQSDIQIRGASFEQTDVLIDGVKVNDPQTGHFNIDIPFFTEDIDKTVVIAGPAASIGGAGRQGGSIHLLIKPPKDQVVQAKTVFGEHCFSNQLLSLTYPVANINSRTTIGRASSDGYRHNTDFDELKFSHISSAECAYGQLQFNFGWLDKEFGANGFYSEFFPEQKEYTNTIFSSLSLRSELTNAYINPQIYIRRHEDRFQLDKTRPSFYENFHTNYIKGAKADVICESSTSRLLTGVDFAQESIDSSSLNKHKRLRSTAYLTYSRDIDNFKFSPGFAGYFYEGFKDHLMPDLSVGYKLNDNFKVRTAFNKSFRAPTFTELYYNSPANRGNENLVPEKSDNYEAGIDFVDKNVSSSLTAFWRNGKNVIDWTRPVSSTVYQVRNIAEVDTQGIEMNLKLFPSSEDWRELFLAYSYVDRDQKETGLISKYVFDYLRHKFVIGSEYVLPFDLVAKAALIYQQRVNKGGDFITNARLMKEFKQYKVFLRADNLFNHAYSEKGNIPMPGRWLFTGLEASW